jgi:hypothetical protein
MKTWRLVLGKAYYLQTVHENNEPRILRSFSKSAHFNFRGCQGFQCYPNNCNLTRVYRWMTPIETSPSSHCPNNMEAACNFLGTYTTTLPCTKASQTEKALLVSQYHKTFFSLPLILSQNKLECLSLANFFSLF